MPYKIIDEVTADCLETNDLIFVEDDEISVYFVIDDVIDNGDSITVYGYNADGDTEEPRFDFDPDQKMNLYMEVDDD